MIFARWTDTVFTLSPRTVAISLLDLPCTINCRTSSSRVVNVRRPSAGVSENRSEPWIEHLLPPRLCCTAYTSSRSMAFLSR